MMSMFLSFVFLLSCSKEEEFSFSSGQKKEDTGADNPTENTSDSGLSAEPSNEPSAAEPNVAEPNVAEPNSNEPSDDTGLFVDEIVFWELPPSSLDELEVGIHSIPVDAPQGRYLLVMPSQVSSTTVVLCTEEEGETSSNAEDLAFSLVGNVAHPVLIPMSGNGQWLEENIEDDIVFVQAMLDGWRSLSSQTTLELFLVGKGTGGGFALTFTAQESSVVGLGMLLSGIPEDFVLPTMVPPLSFLQLINKRDFLVPYSGGNGLQSIPSGISLFRQHNDCSLPVQNSTIGAVNIQEYGGCSGTGSVTLAMVMPSPWHEECEASWQVAVQNDTGFLPPEGILCGSTHELPDSAFSTNPWLFALMMLPLP